MEFQLSEYLILFAASFVVVGSLTPFVRRLAIRLNVVDSPSESHKTHKQPVPYLGGVAIVIGVCVVTYAALFQAKQYKAIGLVSTVLVPAVIMSIIGLIDDVKKLSPWPRFIAQNLVGTCISGFLIFTDSLGSPSGYRLFDVVISVLWIVGITNSINFFDNVDGGASGTVLISAVFLFILAYQGGQYLIGGLAIVLAGSTFGFLIWNKPPARIYMGDAGALFLGVLLASLTLRFNPNPIDRFSSFLIPVLLLAMPILDTSVAVLSRLRRRISPFQGGQDHLSHRLIRSSYSKRQSILILWLFSCFFGSLAVALSNSPMKFEREISVVALMVWLTTFYLFFRTSDQN